MARAERGPGHAPPPRPADSEPAIDRAARPALVICGLLALLYAVQVGFGLTERWALSAAAVFGGRPWTLLTHIGAHGGLIHLAFNLSALAAFGTQFTRATGLGARSNAALIALFLACGVAGGVAFVAFHPGPGPGAVGASGAIFGLWGATARMAGGGRVRRWSDPAVRAAFGGAVVSNLILIPLAAMGGGIAWEAHAGGFLAGLLLAPVAVRWARPRR